MVLDVSGVSRADVAGVIDHTLLKPEACAADVFGLVAEATEMGVYAVCVSPSMVPVAVEAVSPGSLRVAAVAGFPSGKHCPQIKVREAALAVEHGAAEIDMVIDVGAAMAGDFGAVVSDIAGVRRFVEGATLKVIVESAVLLARKGPRALVDACRAAEDAGADFVKTSTGFHPLGGASVHAVELMAGAVGGRLGVKASGGIRSAEDAVAMIRAGATRLGLSATRVVLDGLP